MSKPQTKPRDTQPTISDGRRRRGAKARASILARAIDVASTDGLEGLTIGRLASDVGISKGNIAVLFHGKVALQLATLDAATDVFVARVVTPALTGSTPLQRLRALCDGWFDYVQRRTFPGGCMLYATSNEYRARPGAIQDRVKHHREAWHRLLAATIKAAQQAGEIRVDLAASQLVFELTAFQSAANTAALLGDRQTFVRARRSTRERIVAATERGGSRPTKRAASP
jgi:AcrR family transcriptional regulator